MIHRVEPTNTFWSNILLVFLFVSVLVAVYALRDPLNINLLQRLEHQIFPCKKPLTYSLGTFDTDFGLTQEDFLASALAAEQLWETPLERELFLPVSEKGDIIINLIYDQRQETTKSLQELDIRIENTRESYNELRVRYDVARAQYDQAKTVLDEQITTYNKRRDAYEAEVSRVNAAGGASPEEYRELKEEERALNAEGNAVNAQVAVVNDLAQTVNALSVALNEIADELNITADTYNTIGAELGPEFVEGTFGAGVKGNEINIYQFENNDRLMRVLSHEFGHALGLDHVEDTEAIMYRLNKGQNKELTNDDVNELRATCRIR